MKGGFMLDESRLSRAKFLICKSIFIVVAALATLFVLYGTNAEAVHKGAGALVCGQCHTMHNSQGMVTSGNFTNSLNEGVGVAGGAGDLGEIGSVVLLRGPVDGRNEVHNLCLQCHAENGAQADVAMAPHGNRPPKVYRTTDRGIAVYPANNSAPVDYSLMGSGGDFSFTGTFDGSTWTGLTADDGGAACADDTDNPQLGRGHSLGCLLPTPPGATDAPLDSLSCTNCHDPHGTDDPLSTTINIYRNLKKAPTGGGGGSAPDGDGTVTVTVGTYVGGASSLKAGALNFSGTNPTLVTHTWPVTITGVAADSNTFYEGANDGDMQNGISAWCAQCHDLWHEDRAGDTNGPVVNGGGQDWRRHPVDTEFKSALPLSGGSVEKTDSAHYLNVAVVPILSRHNLAKAGNVIGAGDVNYGIASDLTGTTGAKVFCLSCHWVHGGPWFDNMRWDYTSTVSNGGQVGNSIPSNVGCQICHNR
jgi:hypothetical protein